MKPDQDTLIGMLALLLALALIGLGTKGCMEENNRCRIVCAPYPVAWSSSTECGCNTSIQVRSRP